MTSPRDYPRTERVCPMDVDWQPSLREQAQYRREAKGTRRVMSFVGLVWCLVLGFVAAQHFCDSPLYAVDIQGGANGYARVIGDVPQTAHPQFDVSGGEQ